MHKYKRSHYLIDKGYQIKIVFRLLLICAVGMSLWLATFNYLAERAIEGAQWRVHMRVGTVNEIVVTSLVYATVLSVLLTIFVLFIYFRYMIGKTADPIYRMDRGLEAAAKGDLQAKIWLRKEDEFKDTVLELNKMIESVKKDFQYIRESFSEINTTVNILRYVIDRPELADEKCQSLVTSIENLLDYSSSEKPMPSAEQDH